MSIGSYLETLPLSEVTRYSGKRPENTLPFTGYPRQHPSEKTKLILISDPLGSSLNILEFRLEDVLFVEEVHSAVTESGEGVPLVKLWIRKGAHGVILEPFEVDDPVRFANKSQAIRNRFLRNRGTGTGADTKAGADPDAAAANQPGADAAACADPDAAAALDADAPPAKKA
jgi:hypothetical protein